MKTKRLNKRVNKTKRLNTRATRMHQNSIKCEKVDYVYTDTLAGRTVVLKSLPTDIKKAKRLFTIGDKYIIHKPAPPRLNTQLAIYLKGRDKNLHEISFYHWVLLPK